MPEREVTILAKLTDKMTPNLKKIMAVFGKLGRAAQKAGRMALKSFRGMSRAIAFLKRSIFNLRTLLLGGAFAGVVKVFADFERGIANVATLVDTTTVSMEALSEAVLDVSKATGEGLGSLNEALFDIISAGVEAEQAGFVLLEASKLAKGGATSTAAATKGLVSVMNAYGLSVADAVDLSDSFFTAQKGGITTVDALSRSIGKLAPTASLAGLSVDEMLAAVSAVTKAGVSTTEAVTGMKSVITALIKPTETAREAARKLGIQFDSSRLKGGKFPEFLQEIAEKTELDERVLSKLFTNVKAFATIANLAANEGKSFTEILATMAEKAGATAEAVEKVEQTTSDKFRMMLAQITAFFVGVGGAAKPFIDNVLARISKFFSDLNAKREQTKAFLQTVFNAIGQIGTVIKTIFKKGDVIRFVINVTTEGIEAVIRLIVAAIPTLVMLGKRIGRELGLAAVTALIGSTQEALANQLKSGKRGPMRAGLKLIGFDEAELVRLEQLGRALQDAETNLEIQQARGAQSPAGSQANKRYQAAVADVKNIRDQLGGDLRADFVEVDKAALEGTVKQFLEDSKGIAKGFFSALPEGLSPEVKAAMAKLGDILGPEYRAKMEEALTLDEEARKKAEEAGAEIGASVSKGIGTGFQPSADADDISTGLQEMDIGLTRSTTTMQEFRSEIQRIRALGEGGFITQSEAADREKELIANTRAELDLLKKSLVSLEEQIGGSVPLTKLHGEELEAMTKKLEGFNNQIDDLNAVQGNFLTGFEAGVTGAIDKLGDLRQAGLSAGEAIAGALGEGLIVAIEGGADAFKKFALDFLKQIAQMILKALIFKAIKAGLGSAFNDGGFVGAQKFASGGPVHGPNVNRDVVKAHLTPGEFVQPRGTVDHYGVQIMEALRRRLIPREALSQFGGTVRPIPSSRFLAEGGQPTATADAQPTAAYVVADNDTFDRLINGGQGAFFEFLRKNADTVSGLIRSDG